MSSTSRTAVVVGSGPNGLAAAIRLAEAGLDVQVLEQAATIGGGCRSAELTEPGLVHDVCSAVHPFGYASPAFASFELERHGLEWRWPEVDLAHPLDDGTAGVMVRSLDHTVSRMGPDGDAWRRTFGPLVDRFDALRVEALGPIVHVPRHPVALARFGLKALLPATVLMKRFRTEQTRGLFAGAAAHLFQPLTRPLSASVGLMLLVAGHAVGWPVPKGGSQAIADAMATRLAELGGSIETSSRVTSVADLGAADVVMFDTTPQIAAEVLGESLPQRSRSAFRRWRFGPGAFKLDLAVRGGVPWTNGDCARAGTVHLGGTAEEVVHLEAEAAAGRMPERPFVLVGQQYLCDPERSIGDVHPVWTYAHVPNGYEGDATEAIVGQLERFAPGVRDRIVSMSSRSTADLVADNPNYRGGDIGGGANTVRQLVFGPKLGLDPYATGMPNTYLCSASTPPRGGVHGMCGHHAARSALRHLDRT